MPQWPIDLSQLSASERARVHQLHQNAQRVQLATARLRQQHIAKFFRTHQPRAVDGLGEQTMALDPYWWNFYRQRNRLAPGEDVEMAAWLKRRRGDWCRVRSLPTRLAVGYGSTPRIDVPISSRPVRYRKTYL